jgi:hypothetical protein
MSILLTAAPGSIFAGLEKYIAIWIISVFISSVAQTGLVELKEELWKALTK